MDNVRSIGTEFYGNYNDGGYDKILFLCLKSLQLRSMRNLVEWTDAMELGVANGWVWGGHNWVGYIKPIYPLKPI